MLLKQHVVTFGYLKKDMYQGVQDEQNILKYHIYLDRFVTGAIYVIKYQIQRKYWKTKIQHPRFRWILLSPQLGPVLRLWGPCWDDTACE